MLKDAFVHGWLTRDELDARAGQALAARTQPIDDSLLLMTPSLGGEPRSSDCSEHHESHFNHAYRFRGVAWISREMS